MYRLMKSEKSTFDDVDSRSMSPYRQIQLNQFRQLSAALTACEAANVKSRACHYIINESGKEYYGGTWID